MSRSQLLIASRQNIVIDIVWLLWIMTAFLLFAYLQVYVDIDQSLALKSMVGFSLLIGGTLMSLVLVGFRSDQFFSLTDFSNSILFIFISILAIYFVNIYGSSLQLGSVAISGTLFVVLMGIVEEALFRGFLLSMLVKMTGSSTIAVGLSSLIGMTYHSAVYGTSNTNLLIVFGSFCVLGFCYVFSNYRLSVPMTAHALVNLIASMG